MVSIPDSWLGTILFLICKAKTFLLFSDISILSSLPVHSVDPRVLYSEPAKFVAKLRDMKTDDNILLFKCELGAGHFSKSGR